MHPELAKIRDYFLEAKRLWPINPELVLSRQFFTMWEEAHEPQWFTPEAATMEVAGQRLELTEDESRVACFRWDTDESCAALVVETPSCEQRFLFTFSDGEPVLVDTSLRLYDDDELSLGERLEVMYDIISHLQSSKLSRSVLDITKSEYQSALTHVAQWHDDRVVTLMRRLPLRFAKRLLHRAVEDMAADELSAQLILPLDGSYAVVAQTETDSALTRPGLEDGEGGCQVQPQTRWSVLRQLMLLSRACHLAVEAEKAFAVRFADVNVLGTTRSGDVVVRIPVPRGVAPGNESQLRVFRRGEDQEEVGSLQVDLFDGDALYGRLRWRDPSHPESIDDQLYARPQRSPSRYLSSAVEVLLDGVSSSTDFASDAVAALLGLDSATIRYALRGPERDDMDTSQMRAWASAIDERNAVVLIQGPPGTGKTHVLERVLRALCCDGKRVLVTAPSNTAVDNICRRAFDMPVLRFGGSRERIAPDVAQRCWVGELKNVRTFAARREELSTGGIYAGTHVGLLRSELIRTELQKRGPFDVVVFDEAGMTRMDEFLLCAQLAHRAVLVGDQQQLPPFPLPDDVLSQLRDEYGLVPRLGWAFVTRSALQWLVEQRHVPILLLDRSYRCQNPRLMRFSSTLFYDARVKASGQAEYYRMSYGERQRTFPPSTLRIFCTSKLPVAMRKERLVLEGEKPGLENPLEAEICVRVFGELLQRYPPDQITVIAPYRRHVRLLRRALRYERFRDILATDGVELPSEEEWPELLRARVATVDSFQGGESDAVIVSYVRSNQGRGIGFVGDPNRVNVAHTRCRREMIIIGDMECLKAQAGSRIFRRMERAVQRDGEITVLDEQTLHGWGVDTAELTRATRLVLEQGMD